jgi:hypothetical protein
MKILKIIISLMVLALILISLDFLTMTDTWLSYKYGKSVKPNSHMFSKSIKGGQSAPSKKGIFPDSPYVFRLDCFTSNSSNWENHLKEFKGKPHIHALEIGSFEGMSAIWQLENILTDPTSTITCIDIFVEESYEELFDSNIKATGVAYKVKKLKGSSEIMLRSLNLNQFDYVYIDGCHLPKCVLSDAVLSWDLIKKGGLLIFDDYLLLSLETPSEFRPTKINIIDRYLWRRSIGYTQTPKPAIDAFLKIYGPDLDVVYKKYQVVVKKK